MPRIGIRAATILAGPVFFSYVAFGSTASADANQERCKLLTTAEVRDAIGNHNGGVSNFENEFGLLSCRWTSTVKQQVDGYPDGWFDAIEVAVFDPMTDQWARQQASGDPVAGFVPGALYDSTWGRLWFGCAGTRFCMVRISTAKSDKRIETATRLARLVEGRLR